MTTSDFSNGNTSSRPECDVPVPGIFHFFGGIGKIGTGKKSRNRYRKNLVPEKVSEPVSEKFGTGKKSRNWYRKNLVPKKVPEPVSEIFGTGKKVSVSVSFNNLGTVTHCSRESTGTKIKMPSSHSQLPDNESVENLGVNLCVSSAYIQISGVVGVRTPQIILIFCKVIV